MKSRVNAIIQWLWEKMGFSDFQCVHEDLNPLSWSRNVFLTAQDPEGRKLFIKSGTAEGLYRNEFEYAEAFYRLAPGHAAEPFYYRDDEEIRFFACEYMEGMPLNTWMETGGRDAESKAILLEDLFRIFQALQASGMVHRDIRPQNLLVQGGRLKVVDFQLAVCSENYREPEFFQKERGLLASLGEEFACGCLVWDDAWSLLRIMEYIGRDTGYAARYDEIHEEMARGVGKRVICYGRRDRKYWKHYFLRSKLLSLFALTPSCRNEYRRRKIAARHVLRHL